MRLGKVNPGVLVAAQSKTQDKPRRHHYVPQCYQRSFADGDGKLWTYDRQKQVYFKAPPKDLCFERNLYTIDPGGKDNTQVESVWLAHVDGIGASAIRNLERLSANSEIDDPIKADLSLFIAQQITRSPSYRDMTTERYKVIGQQMLKHNFGTAERAVRTMQTYLESTGEPLGAGVTAESMAEAVQGNHLVVNASAGAFAHHLYADFDFLNRLISGSCWQLIRANQSGFMICDHPFVLLSEPEMGKVGFFDTTKYFPLTRTLCLHLGAPGYRVSYRHASNEEVRVINQNIAVNSERFVMGPEAAQLKHVIERSKTQYLDSVGRHSTEIVLDDDSQSTIGFHFWPRRKYFV